jgi:hypothetical protein
MVNAGAIPVPVTPGITGTANLMSDSLQNGGTSGSVSPNPTGGLPSYGGDSTNGDSQGGTAGTSNQPPTSARSGAGGGGQGTSTNCMTSGEVSPNVGVALGPTPSNFGEPHTNTNPPSAA